MKNESSPSCWFSVVAVLCCGGLVFAALFAVWSLVPRLRLHRREAPDSLLYYVHIVRKFGSDGTNYAQSLRKLLSNPGHLTEQIAKQTHAIATVARRKYRWASAAAYSLGTGLLFLIVLAIVIGSRTLR
ncbi:Pycsar system effector family protein [Mycobacterium sp. GA-0227b]|uniref:Pycsar system effector family protein n=1 Tax=Mycobacterium sp. GA-0227b TaxID=1772274 RepID=UPI00336BEDA4